MSVAQFESNNLKPNIREDRPQSPATECTDSVDGPAPASETTASDVSKHTIGIKLTDEERTKKSVNHKYGLCCSCDAGFDRCTDFIHYYHPSGVYALRMCLACNRYYKDTGTDFDFDNF
jgi:hypothetical protein